MFRLTIRMLLMAMALVIIQASSINGVPVPVPARATTKTEEEEDPHFMEVAVTVSLGLEALQYSLSYVPTKVQKGLETFRTYSSDLEAQYKTALGMVVRLSTSKSKTLSCIDIVVAFLKDFVKLIEPSPSTGKASKIKGKGRETEDEVLAALKPVIGFLVKERGKGTLARDMQEQIDGFAPMLAQKLKYDSKHALDENEEAAFKIVTDKVTAALDKIGVLPQASTQVQNGIKGLTLYAWEFVAEYMDAMHMVAADPAAKTGIDMDISFLKNFLKLVGASKDKRKAKLKGEVLAALNPVLDFLVKGKGKGTLARDIQAAIASMDVTDDDEDEHDPDL